MYPSIFNRFPIIQPVSSRVRHFRTFFAHFGLPWVRPWDNRGKCYMDGKRIQCWSNAQQHIPIYLQPFTSYSEILVGNYNFFLPHAFNAPVGGDPLWRSSWFLVSELPDDQATIWCKNIPEKVNPLSRVHARHRRQTDEFSDLLNFALPLAKRNVVSHVWLINIK